MAVRVLSFHRTYACRDSGVCCSSAWPIPVERDRLSLIRDAMRRGELRPAAGRPEAALVPVPDAPAETPVVLGVSGTHCVFFDAGQGHHCRVQHALGHSALPLACRQFPRVTVQTPLGTSVTLSHYCPTAAGLLRSDERVTIVMDTPAFAPTGEYIGLDVREALPPLLRPDVLMDWEAWRTLEDHAVRQLCDASETAEEGLSRLHTAVEHLQHWRPGSASLAVAIDDAFGLARRESQAYRPDSSRRLAEVLAAIQPDAPDTRAIQALDTKEPRAPATVERRFLAAHAFANWTGYLGHGVRSWFRSVEAAFALLDAGYGVSHADLLLRHLADTAALTQSGNQADR